MFKEIELSKLDKNAVDLIKNRWGLITAGNEASLNTMTVSWGALGELWGKDMVTAYIRPQRYTKEFLDREGYFSLSFYPEELKSIHSVCGTKSGREVDKVKECSLTPDFSENAPFFDEAEIVIICKKAAVGKFEPEQFADKTIIENNYPVNDFHYIYYGEVQKVLVKE